MATHPGMLIAYDASGDVVATLDYLAQYDDGGNVLGLVDFAAHELAGGEMTDAWVAEGATGSKVWPEWIGARAHDFRVELEGPPGGKRIAALIHKASGHRRERAAMDGEIESRLAAARDAAAERTAAIRPAAPERDGHGRFLPAPPALEPEPVDIRDLVGGPDRPLNLDEDGRTVARPEDPPLVPRLGGRVVIDPPPANGPG